MKAVLFYAVLVAAFVFAGPFGALCVTSLLFVLLLPTSPGRQRHRAQIPLRASGTAPFEGCGAVPSSSPDGRASSAALAG